ncbi:hypothetical protein WICMUC_003369 [Wickerhamomyces mucosus]|uniref:SGNH hydrolase-type esterase domain-containing protein n=1 Tax=Wickerhamomyces mucosus TaxID=1378264 RepID=A0A9P8TCE6_9ASCO|nr:hypothetical protein WICMUC_003369 [Wickerhamomyces mucosus]
MAYTFSNSLLLDKFLIFGDSITEFSYNPYPNEDGPVQFGFGAALQHTYTRRLDVVQRGFSGYNTELAIKILPEVLKIEHQQSKSKIKVSTLFFGTNDACLGGVQRIDIHRYIENIKFLIGLFKENDIKVILIGPSKYDEVKFKPGREKDFEAGIIRSNENNLLYSNSLKKIAQEENIPFVDLYSTFDQFTNWKDLLIDGLHYTGEAYKILYNEVLDKIRTWYPELAPENIPFKLPYWRDAVVNGVDIEPTV